MSDGQARLRVAVSMPTLVPGGMGGTETYTRELVAALARRDNVAVRAFVPEAARGTHGDVPETVLPGVGRRTGTIGRVDTLLQAGVLRRGQIRRLLQGADVVHLPFTVNVPAPRGPGVAVTLHDVQHLDLPHLFSRVDHAYRRVFYEDVSRKADVVITISEFSRERIVEHLGLPDERVVVAPLGVDTDGFSVAGPEDRENFVLFPARSWAHKNHPRLVEAVARLREDDPDLRLVLTGGALDRLGPLPDWVDVRGLVPLAELRDLMRRARVLAFPSLYEGFGLPPLEAMASGLPVASSNAGALPEVCGDAAVLFDPTDVDAIADGITRAMADHERLRAAGVARVREFTWDRSAALHEDAYLAAARS
ncbi:glycosyltransferase family 4 protein [Cellulomonas biazotea]|uniref:Uncharacterized protein n=1 Tax=Cellulomonas biazotea TaxID=1709 RepID=A0A402DUB4_9CELL|nr:glycosyltransferase family 1 protein [Cellulomonas biazotea]GCE77682.1 hypothetical protein CBZ_27380 [Cellulomonas biazotea]